MTAQREMSLTLYIHSVKLINFKSIGDYPESEIIIEPRVTAIIGKNESGKSNVLDGISKIDFSKYNPAAFATENINRNKPSDTEIKYVITLKPSKEDTENGLTDDTQITLSKNRCIVSGGLLHYYEHEIHPYFEAVVNALDEINNNPFQLKDQEFVNYKNNIDEFLKKDELDLYRRPNSISYFQARIGKLSTDQKIEYKKIIDAISAARDIWFTLSCLLPAFYYRKSDRHLKTTYKLDEVEKELENPSTAPNSLLPDFIKILGISAEDFKSAIRSGTSGPQETMRRKINRIVENNINQPFKEFYRTEEIKLDLSFNSGSVSFIIQSNDGEALMLSERSNGLRWYFETFIDAQANDILGRNVVYLLDEPGTSLHVNAQRELLYLFQDLADKGNQVIYTTHSPYMLDLESEGVHRIRAVVKDSEGFSRIYKTAYDARIAPESQKDTLAPIISAIGMNLNDTFGPAKDKINIVTEGMSDYIFLCLMAKVLGIDTDKYAIIPSVGATNCIHICSILHGWGCKYIAVFDYDTEGVEKGGEYMREEMNLVHNCNYCYLSDFTQDDIDSKTYKKSTYMIEDVFTREEIARYAAETNTATNIGKPLMAKLISNAVEVGSFELSEKCKNNFTELFSRIFSYCSD